MDYTLSTVACETLTSAEGWGGVDAATWSVGMDADKQG